MTYQIYSHQQLQLKSIARVKQIYSEIACTAEVSDKRCKDSWISAIAEYQASKIQKLSPTAPDEEALAQAELDSYIADQAQVVAPEPLTIVEISFDHHEYYADDKLVASISHDDNHLTQRWVVMVKSLRSNSKLKIQNSKLKTISGGLYSQLINSKLFPFFILNFEFCILNSKKVNDKEVFRANTLMRCDRFIWVESMGDIVPRTSQLNLGVRLSSHPASDVLSLRFCSCVCNRDNSRELLLDYFSSSWRDFRRCDAGEPVPHR